jgi:hypothetical protein
LGNFNNSPYHEHIRAFGYDTNPVTVKSLPVKISKAPIYTVAMCFASNNDISQPGIPISSLHKSPSSAFRLAGNSQAHFVLIDFLMFRHWHGVQGRRSSFGFTVKFQPITRTKNPQNEFRCIHAYVWDGMA